MTVEVLRLLDTLADTLGSYAADEGERELFDAALSLFTPDELLDVFTEQTARRLRAHVASPSALVLSVN
ncbi:MAG: hypothetical protein QOH49_489 [Acidobacteriota bacterium]|jgi:hypothetical protein|nr:hypothetical protein [Acidobacteriota bacterium]